MLKIPSVGRSVKKVMCNERNGSTPEKSVKPMLRKIQGLGLTV